MSHRLYRSLGRPGAYNGGPGKSGTGHLLETRQEGTIRRKRGTVASLSAIRVVA
jgi:hypothetical protein